MRRSAWILLALSLLGCGPVPSLYIHRLKAGVTAERQKGERLKLKRLDAESTGPAQPGFFAIKSAEDWQQFWAASGASPMPESIDYSRKMVLVAATEAAGAQAMRIESAIEDGASMHVYVQSVRAGENCPLRTEGTVKQDVVVLDRTEKPVHFYVETTHEGSCGEAPGAEIACVINGQRAAGTALRANPGDQISCTGRAEQRGVHALTDKQWSLTEIPRGSAARLAYGKQSDEVSFATDLFGRYQLKFESRDEAGRLGEAKVEVQVAPDERGTLVQLVWTSFEPSDDPSTFPRIALSLSALGEGGGHCRVGGSGNAAWCDARKPSDTLQNISLGQQSGNFKMAVHYTDDRFVGGPVACVRWFREGQQRGEVCDKEVRNAGDEWLLGALQSESAALAPLPAEPAPQQAAPSPPEKGKKATNKGTTKAGSKASTPAKPKGGNKPVFRP